MLGLQRRVRATPKLHFSNGVLANHTYVVLRGHPEADTLMPAIRPYWELARSLVADPNATETLHPQSVFHGFPTMAEALEYCRGAGVQPMA